MPELRKDPIVGRWVIIAQNRANRPQELFDTAPRSPAPAVCPFCEGNERETPSEATALRDAGTQHDRPGWRVRVVPNKFPALEMEGDPTGLDRGIYRTTRGVGAHEVIIESPRHLTSTTQLTSSELRDVLWIYRDRLQHWKQDARLVHGTIFKNMGAAAGATLEHVHSQLIVTPIVPISVAEEIAGSAEYYEGHGRCVFCEMIVEELACQERIVDETAGFVAFCPFAARSPYETWIVPTDHASHYETLSCAQSEELAQVMRRVLEKIETALDRAAYNYMIHTAPFDTFALDHYHWHIEVIPRVTTTAGFESGTGFYINPVPPEDAARVMRELPAA
jgi:UDPglucose--hexose-1-phosphate uridylyltransferase